MKILNKDYKPDWEISSGQRTIRTDSEKYDFLFSRPDAKDTVIMDDGEVKDTLRIIESVVWKYIDDTKKLAALLKQKSLDDTLRAIWEFLYHNIQYKLDKPGMEELRRPARSWHDRQSGIDCDCFSIFCSSILCNLGIPHRFRVTRYSQAHWQHIYVIVPKTADSSTYYTVDAVLGKYDYEKPFTEKMDYNMSLNGIKVAVLSGVEDISPAVHDTGRIIMNSRQLAAANNVALSAAIFGVDLQGLGILAGEEYLEGIPKDVELEKGLYRYLVATRQAIAENPITSFVAGYNHQEILKMLDYAIQYWFSDKRDAAIGQLIANEALLDQMNGFGNLNGFLSDDELYGDDDILTGDNEDHYLGLGKAKKKSKPKAKKAKTAKPKAKKKGFFKKIGAGIKKVAKGVAKGVVRFNPATIAARNGFLLALKMNVGKMATRLKWAYATPEQAKAKGISAATVQKGKNALVKIEKLFTKIGGKPANLKKAILSGKKGKLSGTDDELGAVPVAAAVAAATPLIVAVVKILKQSGLANKDEDIDISSYEGDAVEDDGVYFDDYDPYEEAGGEDDYDLDFGEDAGYEEGFEGLGNIATGAIKFAQNNPLLGLAIGGAVAFGVYKMLDSSKENKEQPPELPPELSGTPRKGRHPPNKVPVFRLQ